MKTHPPRPTCSRRLLVRVAATLLLACACDAGHAASNEVHSPAKAPMGSGRPQKVVLGASTEGGLALRNLDAQIEGLEAAVKRQGALTHARTLVALWLSRAQFTGRFEDLTHAGELASELTVRHPDRPEAWLTLADALSAVHLFAEAHDALDLAEERGAPAQLARRTTYWLATGENLAHVYAWRSEHAREHPSYDSLTAVAGAAAALGHYEEADHHYAAALLAYRDVSPLPIAWVQFQRGVMWGEMANRPDAARPLYEAAVERVPGYVVANVHLAELEREEDLSAAIERLERVVESDDPEPRGKLADCLLERDPERSARLAQSAAEGYGHWLSQHREAFLDHASEFFVGVGADPARGLGLAIDNLERRKNARAYVIALSAADAAGDEVALCALIDEAKSAPESLNLRAALQELSGTECSALR